jgi:hypothetical protein
LASLVRRLGLDRACRHTRFRSAECRFPGAWLSPEPAAECPVMSGPDRGHHHRVVSHPTPRSHDQLTLSGIEARLWWIGHPEQKLDFPCSFMAHPSEMGRHCQLIPSIAARIELPTRQKGSYSASVASASRTASSAAGRADSSSAEGIPGTPVTPGNDHHSGPPVNNPAPASRNPHTPAAVRETQQPRSLQGQLRRRKLNR